MSVVQSAFFDLAAMMGDLPQAASFSDVLRHSSNTLCSHRCIRNHENHTIPKTNHSSEQHSGRWSLMCFGARRKAIRACISNKLILQKLRTKTTFSSRDLPADYFSSMLATITHRPPISETHGNFSLESIQLAAFDHALSVPPLSDHLISTMASSVLKPSFEKLKTDKDSAIVKLRIVEGVLTNDMELK